jgi:hypothetical protein
MLHLSFRQKLAVLALLTAVAVPWTSDAAPLVGQQPASPGLLQRLWTALTGFWDAGANLDDGCTWDPNGRRCAAQSVSTRPTLTTQDAGCINTKPTVTQGAGCQWDPVAHETLHVALSGYCLPGS